MYSDSGWRIQEMSHLLQGYWIPESAPREPLVHLRLVAETETSLIREGKREGEGRGGGIYPFVPTFLHQEQYKSAKKCPDISPSKSPEEQSRRRK